MSYQIEGQSPNEVENIRQRVNLEKKVGELDRTLQKSSSINPHIIGIYNLLKRELENQVGLNEIFESNQRGQMYIDSKLDNINLAIQDNVVNQTDLDEIYKNVKNNRSNVNKKLNDLKKQIKEQNEKIDKIIELLEKKQ